jgi:hypothetical protein
MYLFFFYRYAKTSKALALLLRQRIYHQVESGLQYFNEKSGWTQVEKVLFDLIYFLFYLFITMSNLASITSTKKAAGPNYKRSSPV